MSRSVVSAAQDSRRVRQQFGNYYVQQQQQHHHYHHHHQEKRQSSYSKSDDEFITSDAVYASRYTSSFTKEDMLVAKIHHLRHKTLCLFRKITGPDPEEMRGRPRYRDWEY